MRLLTIAFLFTFLVTWNLQAQYLSSKDSDPEAVALLTKAGQAFSSKNTQVQFNIKLSQPGQEPLTQKGTLYQSGKSYHLDMQDYAIFSDGKTRWVHLKGPKEINIYNESDGQDWISPQDFLQLHTATDLVFVMGGTRSDGITMIEAKPLKGRFDSYSKFSIGIKNGELNFISGLSSDGSRQEMTIGTVSHPYSMDAQKLFTYKPENYPGVYVEDLRID